MRLFSHVSMERGAIARMKQMKQRVLSVIGNNSMFVDGSGTQQRPIFYAGWNITEALRCWYWSI